MHNISAVTETIKKIPQLLSSVSKDTWAIISATAAGIIGTVGSVVSAYKFAHRKDQEKPVAPSQLLQEPSVVNQPVVSKQKKTLQPLSAWDELKISPQHRQEITQYINQIKFSLNGIKKEGTFHIKGSENTLFTLKPVLMNLWQVMNRAGEKRLVDNSKTFNELQDTSSNLMGEIDRLDTYKNQPMQRETRIDPALLKQLATLEEKLNAFEKEFK